MEEAREDVLFLAQAAQALEELLLGLAMHHEVGPGDQQLGRHLDRLGIGHHPVCRFIQAQQDVDRNRLGDQRIAVIALDSLRVVAQEACLDVAVDEEVAAKAPHQGQAGTGERYVELDLEGRGGQHQGADPRRVVVDPGGGDHRADALGHHGDVVLGDLVGAAQVVAEGLHVAHAGGEARAVAPGTRRLAVAAGIPGEEIDVRQVQLVHQVGDAPGVLVAAVEQHHRLARRARSHFGGWPMAVEQFDTIMGPERLVLGFAHSHFLMQRERCAELLRAPGGPG